MERIASLFFLCMQKGRSSRSSYYTVGQLVSQSVVAVSHVILAAQGPDAHAGGNRKMRHDMT